VIRRFCAPLIVVATVLAASVVVTGSAAAAGPPRHTPPDLVALGDSFAAGTGNTPYSDPGCGRSASAAYSERLDQLRLVALQAFPACGGYKTFQVAGQVGAITPDTDIVTVQALGNDFDFSILAGYCLSPETGVSCHRSQQLAIGMSVQQLLDSIRTSGPALLKTLYDRIDAQVSTVGAKATVIVVDYGDPFPSPTGRVGPFCPTMDREELGVAADFANGLNAAMQTAIAGRSNYVFANAAPRFRGLDICGFTPAFFRPPLPGLPSGTTDPAGYLHPNAVGQGIYAAVLAGRLYS
jgi:hypothetical protein